MNYIRERRRTITLVLIITFTVLSLSLSEGYADDTSKKNSQEVSLLFGGDLLCQYNQQEAAFDGKKHDFNYAFDYVRDLIKSADFAIANLETNIAPSKPLSKDMQEKYGKPYLNSPIPYLTALKNAGFDVLASANNHNADTDVAGLKETISNIDAKGFLRTGIFKNSKEKRYLILKKNGIKIGLASYATYFNDSVKDFSEKQKDTYLNEYDESKVKKDIKNMKKQGADYIIIYFHCGTEYTDTPSSKQYRIAQEIADAGADYILCSHSHTVMPYDRIKAKSGKTVPVAYGLGNFISHMKKKRKSTYGMMISLTLTKEDGKVKIASEGYYPLRTLSTNPLTGKKYQLLPVTQKNIEMYQDKTTLNRLKVARQEIAAIVGNKIKQY